jgi:Helix-turn-helix domain
MRPEPADKVRRLGPHAITVSPAEGAGSRAHGFPSSRATESPVRIELRDQELRTYTEAQVAVILQVSRSQLRKWRMGWSRGRREGPPFKKIGRIVRYPESGLRAFIYGP